MADGTIILANVRTGVQYEVKLEDLGGGLYALAVGDGGGSQTVDSAQLPAALAANGGLKVEGVAGGVAQPVSGTFWQATQPVSVAPASALLHGQKIVTTAGTEVALAASGALTAGVRVKALHDNTGMVYVGANPVTSSTGFELAAGEEVFLEVSSLASVYVDAAEDGEGVSYIGS